VDRKPLEDMVAYLAEQSRYSFRLAELPGGEKTLYFDPDGRKKAAGRPPKGSEKDWSAVDWTKSDVEISREMGVARQSVRSRRAKLLGLTESEYNFYTGPPI